MKILKIKYVLVTIFLAILCFLVFEYWSYLRLKNYVTDYKNNGEENVIAQNIAFYYTRFGMLPFSNNDEFRDFVRELRDYSNQGKEFAFEKYTYGIILDSISNNYMLYSDGPNNIFDNLQELPLNSSGSGKELNSNNLTFIKYLFMNNDFDILLTKRELNYNCSKHKDEIYAILDKSNFNTKEGITLDSFAHEISSLNKYLAGKETVKKIVEGMKFPIFTYHEGRIKCICCEDFDKSQTEELEKEIVAFINGKFSSLEFATFYLNTEQIVGH